MSTHHLWVNDYKIEERIARGYRFVFGAEGKLIYRGGGVSIRQVLMGISEEEFQAREPTPVRYDTGYNDYIPTGSPYALKPEGQRANLIPDSPVTDNDGYLWDWYKHPMFAWVRPGNVLRGHTNWFINWKFFRLVIRPDGDRSIYIRIGWWPPRFNFICENREEFSEQFK